jgi:hypothetical protein
MSRATARIKEAIAALTGSDKVRKQDHHAEAAASKAVAEKMKDVAKDAIDDLCDAANKRSR